MLDTRLIRPMLTGLLLSLCARPTLATTVKELTRINGQGESILRGVGLVVGLPNTGDNAKDLAVARPLLKLMENNGQVQNLPSDIGKVTSVALVSVTCVVPREGARADDTLDVAVSSINSASSLAGGELYLTALQGPLVGAPVFAVAAGRVELDTAGVGTSGRVHGGARMIRDVLMPQVGDTFDLVIEPPFAGWPSAATIANAIQSTVALEGRAYAGTPKVAQVIDERTIRIVIPPEERADKAAFLADVLSSEVRTELLDLPAQVIVNQRTGAIIVTGDVTISPVAITHKDLAITTVTPQPKPTVQSPEIRQDSWTDFKTTARPSEVARLTDLLTAFKQLDIPVNEQINILQMLHKTGKLQARLVVD